ncbi:MAG: hypothetical protein JW709_03030 [Sedimentisphaerales bacterium]|nr:hypothetical protein [Sedimentisphaerales bacterium]
MFNYFNPTGQISQYTFYHPEKIGQANHIRPDNIKLFPLLYPISHPQVDIQLHAAKRVLKEPGWEDKDILLVFIKMNRPNNHLPSLQRLHPRSCDILCS